MKNISKMFSIMMLGVSASVVAAESEDFDRAGQIETNLVSAKEQLNAAIDGTKDAETKVKLFEAVRKIDLSLTITRELKESLAGTQKLDLVVEQARVVQKMMAGLLGVKETFGYKLKQSAVDIDIDVGATYGKILKERLEKAGIRIGASGRVRLGGRNDVVSDLNALKAEFYGLLVEAASLDAADTRVAALANWGNQTKVIYPGETFGQEIIPTRQLWDLNLK